MELYADVVSKTIENFCAPCTSENNTGRSHKPLYFKGLLFHRVIPGFKCQGPDFVRGNNTGGGLIYGEKFSNESFVKKHTGPAIFSISNTDPNTNGSQFLICTARTSWLDGKHVIFGQVVEGLEVMREIEKVGFGSGRTSKIEAMAKRGGGFKRSFGRGRGDRGCKDSHGGRRALRRDEEGKFHRANLSVTKPNSLVKEGIICSLKKIYPFLLAIEVYENVGDGNGHAKIGVKCSKELDTVNRGAINLTKFSVTPGRRGYWGNWEPHTETVKKCGSRTVRMMPTPRGSKIGAARMPLKNI